MRRDGESESLKWWVRDERKRSEGSGFYAVRWRYVCVGVRRECFIVVGGTDTPARGEEAVWNAAEV